MMKKIYKWFKTKWLAFERFLDRLAPKIKTKLVAFLGMVGSTAAVVQEYITGLPTSTMITAEKISIATAVLFTLSFWFRNMGDRTK